ncbi:MAG: hypothetical protein F4Y80_01640 [Caldilineaceae bacterium SB0665_bin_21]|nr:hypothetical protein [Caldilineaceae bacterium SB0665_bin_21]
MDASEGTDELADLFPKLATQGFKIVEPPSDRYNCIAFAAGDTGAWWSIHSPDYWRAHATRSNRIANLVEVFAGLDFERCRNSRTEPDFGKVALYEQLRAWTHAAVQTPQGTWLSNIGAGSVIEHDNPEALTGGVGNPTNLHVMYLGNTKADLGQPPTVIHGPVLHTGSRTSRCSNHRHC